MPWLGYSATLDLNMLTEIQELCEFDPLVRYIKLAIRCAQHSVDTSGDLDFLIEPVKAAVERMAEGNRDNIAREALKRGDKAAAQATASAYTRQEIKQAASDSRACCRMIPKTVVHIDSIKLVEAAAYVLVERLIQACCSKTSTFIAVEAYQSELTEFDRRSFSAELLRPDAESVLESPRHRIIVATDAMGISIDNPDIRIIVQWKQPLSVYALWQRAG